MKTFIALALALAVTAGAGPAAADDSCLRQGTFAMALAERVHLAAESEAEAVKSLSEVHIRPAAGWDISLFLDDKAFGEIDRSVMVAFAEGKIARGNPSAARAVLAGATMDSTCRKSYFATTPPSRSPDMLVMPLPTGNVENAGALESDVPRQQRTAAGSTVGGSPEPVADGSVGGREPAPGGGNPGDSPEPVADGPAGGREPAPGGGDPGQGGDDPSPGEKDPTPGTKEPAPGEKDPDPISPIDPGGPNRPGPGVK